MCLIYRALTEGKSRNRRFAELKVALLTTLLSPNFAQEPLFDHADAFDLAFGRKAFVKTFVAEFIFEFAPGRKEFFEHAGCRIFTPFLYEVGPKSEIGQH